MVGRGLIHGRLELLPRIDGDCAEGLRGFLQELASAHLAVGCDQAMGGQDDQPWVLHTDERDHAVVETGVRRGIGMLLPHLVAIVERRLVPVMTVGDDQVSLGGHLLPHCIGDLRVRHRPELLRHVLLEQLPGLEPVCLLDRFVQQLVDPVPRIEHEDVAEVDLGRTHQVEPVDLRPGVCPLVRQYRALVEGHQLQGGDQTLTRLLCPVRQCEALPQDVERRCDLAHQDAVFQPGLVVLPCPRVHILLLVVLWSLLPLDDPHDVIWAPLVVLVLKPVSHAVVGLADDRRHVIDSVRVVPCASE